MQGTRSPPSHVVDFSPRNGPLTPPNSLNMVHGPLSLVNTKIVFFVSFSASSVFKICPTDQSISSITSPYTPFALLPSNLGDAKIGTCGMLCAR